MRMSMPMSVEVFSVVPLTANQFRKWTRRGSGRYTSSDVERDLFRTASSGITAYYTPAQAAVVSAEGIVGEFLLAEGAVEDFGIFFPGNDGLFEFLSLVLHWRQGP